MRGSSTNIVDALSRTPGVSQISTGPAISKPTIRGLGYNRLIVMNDGIRQEGQQWGDAQSTQVVTPRTSITFSGKVTDANTGLPLPAASIYFSDLRVGTSANIEGNFTLTNLPRGTYLVEISHLGYGSFIENITLS